MNARLSRSQTRQKIAEGQTFIAARRGTAPTICGLFVKQSVLLTHLAAPLLAEREKYVARLASLSRRPSTLRDTAVLLHNASRLMLWDGRTLTEADLGILEEKYTKKLREHTRLPPQSSGEHFTRVVRNWLKFLGFYKTSDSEKPFAKEFASFLSAMSNDFGYLPTSVKSLRYTVEGFLLWVGARRTRLSEIDIRDVDEYIAEKRAQGWRTRTVAGACRGLRRFFKHAELLGWSECRLSKTIKSPICRPYRDVPGGPTWKQVRAVIAKLNLESPSHCRARAVLLLASVYGLRTCEIARLQLDDLDWYNEVLTLRRAKRGRIQQFPIQYEVGEAIIDYLRRVRPVCEARNVFISLSTPYRPMDNFAQAMRKFLNVPTVFQPPCGLHALRHASATELLRRGTSLKGIADFLGHRGLRSVSIYARSDMRSLRRVAAFNLKDLL